MIRKCPIRGASVWLYVVRLPIDVDRAVITLIPKGN